MIKLASNKTIIKVCTNKLPVIVATIIEISAAIPNEYLERYQRMIPGSGANNIIITPNIGIKCSTKATKINAMVPNMVSLGLIFENNNATSKLKFIVTILQALRVVYNRRHTLNFKLILTI